MPAGLDVAELDALCSKSNAGVRVDIPTAIGFCMYIKRDVLRTIGLFDEARWGKGDAEENDFCVKASGMWRPAMCLCSTMARFHCKRAANPS